MTGAKPVPPVPPMGVLVVTGTGTGVGKTVTTAAIAALALAAGQRVSVVKPAQTGLLAGAPGDVDDVRRLAGLDTAGVHEVVRYPDPLAPASAARMCGLPTLDLAACAALVSDLAGLGGLVLVEGAGGLLVRFDDTGNDGRGSTLADLATALGAPVLLVADPGLGTLNQAALTLEALTARGLELAGLVLGSWPAAPDLACRTNIADLERLTGQPLAGALPAGLGDLDAPAFLAAVRSAVGPGLGGDFDAADFGRRHTADR